MLEVFIFEKCNRKYNGTKDLEQDRDKVSEDLQNEIGKDFKTKIVGTNADFDNDCCVCDASHFSQDHTILYTSRHWSLLLLLNSVISILAAQPGERRNKDHH